MECTQFGADAAIQDELAELVISGPKRATSSRRRWYGPGGERFPAVGDLFVVLDARRTPRYICRTTAVEIRAFRDVDAAFAWDEGEGDRTLRAWQMIHQNFFPAEARAGGFDFSEDSRIVLHRFEMVTR